MLMCMRMHPTSPALIPADENEAAVLERLRQCGGSFRVLIRQQVNNGFRRKGFALMRYLH